ncbi:hypothetical protein WA026_007777 [Henosepilachna vigintioctopunctata]|uniref:Uncharacterized protein n=1 Tax=Henosepilachna vigintioctopunctata TaxID=420089 RepID=A0AAW1TUZ9_9CUCU
MRVTGQLSTRSKIISAFNSVSHFLTSSSKNCAVIQAALFALYVTGNCFMFLIHGGFLELPITKSFLFSVPFIVAAPRIIIRSLEFSPQHIFLL